MLVNTGYLACSSLSWLGYLHYFLILLFFCWPSQGLLEWKVNHLPLCKKIKWLLTLTAEVRSCHWKPAQLCYPLHAYYFCCFCAGKQLCSCHLLILLRAFVNCCASCQTLTSAFDWIQFTWQLNWCRNRAATGASKAWEQFRRRGVHSSQMCERKALSSEQSSEGKTTGYTLLKKNILDESLNSFMSKTQCTLL